jgi:hypothetical protein
LLFFLIAIGASTQVQDGNKKKGAGDPKNDGDVIAGTLGALQTEGLVHADQVDPDRTWTGQLASQKLPKRRSRQIYYVEFFMRSGEKVNAIAVRDESPIVEESGLMVYVVSRVCNLTENLFHRGND